VAGLVLGAAAASSAGGDDAASAAPPPEPPPAAPAADCAAALTARVQARYDRMRNLEARFTQRTISAVSPGGEVSSGIVTLAKPGKMRWSYETPEPSLVVSDGTTLWIFDPEAREAQKMAVGAQFLSGAAFQFLLGNGRIADSFRVSVDHCDAPRARLTLIPIADATYERLELQVDSRSGEARATAVLDLFGNRTEVEFRDVKYDRALSPDVFGFTPGPDVRVIELEPAAS
jgi:outer membrane lipoprotein carrier protein